MIGIPGSSIKECWLDGEGQPEGELKLGKKKSIDREESLKRQPARKLMDERVIVPVHT